MLLETLLVVFSMIAMGSLFFLIYITWTLNDRLQDNDDVINKLQDEMFVVNEQLAKHEEQLKFKVKKISESPSVSGVVRKMKVPD